MAAILHPVVRDWFSQPHVPGLPEVNVNIPNLNPLAAAEKVFVVIADARYISMSWTADFAKDWNENTASPIRDDFGPFAGAVVTMIGFVPFLVVTVLPYSNPWTIVPAIIVDAYNYRRYGSS